MLKMLLSFVFVFVFNVYAGVTFVPVEKYSTPAQRNLIAKAQIKFNETVSSACFKDFILNRKMNQTQGRTSAQVYEHLSGMNTELPVRMYFRKYGKKSFLCPTCTIAVAYRQPSRKDPVLNKTVFLNASFFDSSKSSCRWAGTLGHEGMGHALGNYGHSSGWSVAREYTVPYSINGSKDHYGGSAFSHCCVD